MNFYTAVTGGIFRTQKTTNRICTIRNIAVFLLVYHVIPYLCSRQQYFEVSYTKEVLRTSQEVASILYAYTKYIPEYIFSSSFLSMPSAIKPHTVICASIHGHSYDSTQLRSGFIGCGAQKLEANGGDFRAGEIKRRVRQG